MKNCIGCTRASLVASTVMIIASLCVLSLFVFGNSVIQAEAQPNSGTSTRNDRFENSKNNGRGNEFVEYAREAWDESPGGKQSQAGKVQKMNAEGKLMRIQPVYQLQQLEAESPAKAAFLEDVLIPLTIKTLTRTFSLKYPVQSKLLFQRKCKRSIVWGSGERECQEYFSESDQKCNFGTIPSDMFDQASQCSGDFPGDCRVLPAGKGVENSDFYLIVTASVDGANCNEGGESAQGGYCMLDDESGRPIAGFINFCPNSISSDLSAVGSQLDLAVHELLHAIVFEPALFESFRDPLGREYENPVVISTDPTSGNEVRTLTTPKVKEVVRKHFNCDNLKGAELENQGGSGTQWSHWEESLFYDEVMTGLQSGSQRSVLSNLTLALLEDSGWYMPDYSFGGYLGFGKNAGCDFAMKKCRSNSNTAGYFCSEIGNTECTYTGQSLGRCEINPLADGCAIVKGFNNYVCADEQNSMKANAPLQVFGDSSMCVQGDSVPWKMQTKKRAGNTVRTVQSTYPSASAGCFRFACKNNNVVVDLGGYSFPCEAGSYIDLSTLDIGFLQGSFGPCPSQDVCSENLSCNGRCNTFNGQCAEGVCYCYLGWYGNNCDMELRTDLMQASGMLIKAENHTANAFHYSSNDSLNVSLDNN